MKDFRPNHDATPIFGRIRRFEIGFDMLRVKILPEQEMDGNEKLRQLPILDCQDLLLPMDHLMGNHGICHQFICTLSLRFT